LAKRKEKSPCGGQTDGTVQGICRRGLWEKKTALDLKLVNGLGGKRKEKGFKKKEQAKTMLNRPIIDEFKLLFQGKGGRRTEKEGGVEKKRDFGRS